jgi:hypothetical protein
MKNNPLNTKIFSNPFLVSETKEKIKLWSEDKLDLKNDHGFLVKRHEFNIVSEHKNSKRYIAWLPYCEGESFKRCIFEETDWKQIYLWTTGSMSLHEQEDDSLFLELDVDATEGYVSPDIIIVRPFLQKMGKEINDTVSDGFFQIKFSRLDQSNFSSTVSPFFCTRRNSKRWRKAPRTLR